MWISRTKLTLVDEKNALIGRDRAMSVPERHAVLGTPLEGSFAGAETALFGMGCFWGAERLYWEAPGVISTAVGYAGGFTPHPTYEEVSSGLTGHAEVVRVVFDPTQTDFTALLRLFWESHDPTQGMQQGPDLGTQYRSAIYVATQHQREAAEASCRSYQRALAAAGRGGITTEIREGVAFYFAEPYHQQFLAKNPQGYCGHGGTGVACSYGTG